jgi:3-oxoacyl-[acyl-carrier protein] reductase
MILVARDRKRLSEVALEIERLGKVAIPLALDLTEPVILNVAIARVWRNYGPIHLLINCAGVAHQSPFLQSRLPQVQEEISVNLIGMYTITRLIGRRMASRREGHIINVSSLMGKIAAPTMATYSATKFAILGFTQALRGELAAHNVKVTVLLPTLTDTDMVRGMQWFRWIVPMTSQQVAKALADGLRRESLEIPVGWQSRLAILGSRLSPWFVEKVVQLAAPLS